VPHQTSAQPSRRLRRILLATAITVLLTATYGCIRLGSFLAAEDPLTSADAIFIFAGTQAERPLEGADLYKAGYAPVLVLTRPTDEPAVEVLARRGIRLPSRFTLMRDVLRKLEIPDSAIIVPDRIHDNTAQEADTLRVLAATHRWRRVILVSSKYHLRRVGMAARRSLRDSDVTVILRPSRYDPATPDRWWQHRADLRQILWELPKVIGYAVGVGE
jgi:uncharacterized SAM-binding protein YcdF (DUF218 family)